MALGDVYRKVNGAWGPHAGSLRGPGPAQLNKDWLPIYDNPFPGDNDTLALWDFREPSGSTTFTSCSRPIWVPLQGEDGPLTPIWPEINNFVGPVVAWRRGPTGRLNWTPEGRFPRMSDFDEYPLGIITYDEWLRYVAAVEQASTTVKGGGGSVRFMASRVTNKNVGLSTAYWYNYQYTQGGTTYRLLGNKCPVVPSDNKFTVSLWLRFSSLPKAPTRILGHYAMTYYTATPLVNVEIIQPPETGGRGQALKCFIELGVNDGTLQIDSTRLPINEWFLLSITHDWVTFRLYVNGIELANGYCPGQVPFNHQKIKTDPGDIFVNASCPDPWWIGTGHSFRDPATDAFGQYVGQVQKDMDIGPVWIEETVRSADFLRDLYERGTRRF